MIDLATLLSALGSGWTAKPHSPGWSVLTNGRTSCTHLDQRIWLLGPGGIAAAAEALNEAVVARAGDVTVLLACRLTEQDDPEHPFAERWAAGWAAVSVEDPAPARIACFSVALSRGGL